MIKKVKCQKSNFNLENNKCICQENLFIYQVTRSTYSIIIFSIIFLCEFKGYIYIYETLNRIGEICIRVNNFEKLVNL